MIHNKNNDIDGMIFVRLFQRHAGKACQSCRIKHGIITSKIIAQVGHMMQARATAAAVCSDNIRVGVLPVAMQQTTVQWLPLSHMLVGSELPNSELRRNWLFAWSFPTPFHNLYGSAMLPTNNHSSYLSSVSGRKPIRSNAFAAQFYDGQNASN